MSTPITSEDLRAAIERLRPELPELLEEDHPAFAAELDSLLREGSDNQLLDLFGRYPAAHERLLDALDVAQRVQDETKIAHLFGNEIIPPPGHRYRCKVGPHHVASEEVVQRDPAGNALCPQHGTVMTAESPCRGEG